MRIVKPSFEIWEQSAGLEGVYKQIERVGRVCYKSEDKITESSAKPFVDRMIKSGHGAMLEHGTIYLKINLPVVDIEDSVYLGNWLADFYYKNKYSKINYINNILYITTNLRVIIENNRLEDLSYYLCEPTEYHEKRVAVKFICDRGVSHELVRHKQLCVA